MAGRPASPPVRIPPLRVDEARFPNLKANPALERALRIRQALDQGRPRDEAVRLAEQAMGPRAPHMMHSPGGRPQSSHAKARPKRKAAKRR